eukprot:m.22682 g.22682  ORF g.22682 m.22682 type:complete len:191 (+) comp34225_c0_seq2:206-778(+)
MVSLQQQEAILRQFCSLQPRIAIPEIDTASSSLSSGESLLSNWGLQIAVLVLGLLIVGLLLVIRPKLGKRPKRGNSRLAEDFPMFSAVRSSKDLELDRFQTAPESYEDSPSRPVSRALQFSRQSSSVTGEVPPPISRQGSQHRPSGDEPLPLFKLPFNPPLRSVTGPCVLISFPVGWYRLTHDVAHFDSC